MPSDSSHLQELVDQMPDSDKDSPVPQDRPQPRLASAGKFTGPDPAVARRVYEQILSGGKENVGNLLKLVRMPEDPHYVNDKPSYVVHGLVIHCAHPERKPQRALLLESLLAELENDQCPKPTKEFFIREVELMGDRSAVKTLARALSDEALCSAAAQALVSIRTGSVEVLKEALGSARDKARLAILHALGALADTDTAPLLREALQGASSQEEKLVVARALADLGDAPSASSLIQLADNARGWERIQATHCCLLLAEQLARSGKRNEASQVYTHLRDTRTEPNESHVKAAAETGLKFL